MKPFCLLLLSLLVTRAYAQDALTNGSVVAMNDARVSRSLISQKIKAGRNNFDVSTPGLIALKTAGVPDALLEEMLLASSARETLRNDDVIRLQGARLSQRLIIQKIQSSPGKFDLSPEGLIALKMAKVPDRIVNVMLDPAKGTTGNAGKDNVLAHDLPDHPDLPPPGRGRFPETGLYYEAFQSKPARYEQLEPTTTNQTKSGSFGESVASSYTGGITGSTQRVGLANPSANLVIEDKRPVFYFIFGNTRKQMDDVAENVFGGVASPNEFVLLKARTANRQRQLVIGRNSAYTSESGVGEGAIPFRFKKISPAIYRVYFDQDVPAGEYVFFYNKSTEFNSSIKVYDFSLRNNVKR